MAGKGNYRHGGKGTRIYIIWKSMRERCNTTTATNYSRYGGRGISICKEWDNFDNFRTWAFENGYSKNLSLDRKDNNKGYSPDNCRWATPKEQARNTRNTRFICFNNECLPMTEWAERTGIRSNLIGQRLKRGWSIERALTEIPYIGKNQTFREKVT